MTHVFHRKPLQTMPCAVRGDGIRIYDEQGRAYIDASGGAAVSCLGHGHPEVIAAMKAQLDRLAYVHSSFFTTTPSEELAEFLSARAPGDLDHVYFVSGGSEAVEAALKLARQYFVERGEPERSVFIARRQSYHGNTLGALSVGGNMARRAAYLPLLTPAQHVSPCYPYRHLEPGETTTQYADRLAMELENTIQTIGPGRVIAFVAETVVGSSLGAQPPVPGYFKRMREVCDRHGVLLILDEVMSGMGRTGTLFACEQDEVTPDLVTIAKGLGGGFQPIGAMLASHRIYETVVHGSGFFQHGHTYMGHVTASAAALATQRIIERDGLLDNVSQRGEQLQANLRKLLAGHPNVGDIRGRGLFTGIELVQDRASKEPLDPARRVHAEFKRQAMANGLMTYPGGGTADGVRGDHIMLAPPFICTPADIEEITERVAHTLNQVLPA